MSNRTIKLTACVVIGGQLIPPGSLVEVTKGEARDLLRRGKAEPHEEDTEGEDVIASGNTDPDEHPDIAEFNADAAQGAADAPAEGVATDAPAPAAPRRGRPPRAAQ